LRSKENKNRFILIKENNEEIGELIKLLHKNKDSAFKKIFIDVSSHNKNKTFSQRCKSNKNIYMNSNFNKNINNRSVSFSKGRKGCRTISISTCNNNKLISNKKNISILSKGKKLSSNNSFYKNSTQNNIHTNIIVKDFSNKSKEKIDKNFKGLINYSKQSNLNIANDLKQKGKELKKLSLNNSFYKNQTQNNIHTNIIVRDFSNKSKEKIDKNFKGLINYSKQSNLNIANGIKQKEKELKKQIEINNNLTNQNNFLLEKIKKLEKNEENLKQKILNIQNELNQKQQELEK